MKKLLVVLTATVFGLTAAAQECSIPSPLNQVAMQIGMQNTGYDAIVMKDGKVYLMKGNERTLVTKDASLGGTKVGADGIVTYTDGTLATMKEGDKVLPSGKLIKAPKPDQDSPQGDFPPKN